MPVYLAYFKLVTDIAWRCEYADGVLYHLHMNDIYNNLSKMIIIDYKKQK